MKRWIMAATALFLSACSCRVSAPSQAYEFETDCTDATCGFRATTGTIQRTTSLVAGEHGVEFAPSTTAVNERETPWRGSVVSFIGWCEEPNVVRVEVTLEELPDGGTARVRTTRASTVVTNEWSEQRLTLPAGTVVNGVVQRVVLSTGSAGRCILDTVYVGDTRAMCPF